MIGKPRGRYARVAFELTLRNLGLASLPGPLPSGANLRPASPGIPMDSDKRTQPTYARVVYDRRILLHPLGPQHADLSSFHAGNGLPHCGRAASWTRTRTTSNHGTRTRTGRVVELDSSHFGIRLIPTQAKAPTRVTLLVGLTHRWVECRVNLPAGDRVPPSGTPPGPYSAYTCPSPGATDRS